jgi:aspartyl-tRNA(Asn)/glutamyl-tRNA(Gln) amidotransferase subunit A
VTETLRERVSRIRAIEDGPGGVNAFLALAETDSEGREGGFEEGHEGGRGDGEGRTRLGAEPEGTTGTSGVDLAGAAVAVKDNLVTRDLPTTCASRVLEGYRSPFDATAVRRVRRAGGRLVGKTNLDEFGMGSSTENSAFGPTLNPRDPTRVPGGSSGGSAAAVAAGYVRMALGSDTGGSIRQPAALCGVVGIKPTYGRVSRYGLVAYASSLDQVGTFGATVEDAATLLEAVAGHDARDATSVDRKVPNLRAAAAASVQGMVVGVPEEYFPLSLHEGVRGRVREAIRALEAEGAMIRPVSLPSTDLAIPCFYVIAPAEASSNLARYDGVRYGVRGEGDTVIGMYENTRASGLGAEVKRRIMLGTYALSAGYHDAYYGNAQRVRARIRADFARVFSDGVDVLITPTTPEPAFRLGEKTDDPLSMYLSDVFTVTANLAGIPGMSVPAGAVDGLPVGAQLLAPWWQEAPMIAAGAAIERHLQEGGA